MFTYISHKVLKLIVILNRFTFINRAILYTLLLIIVQDTRNDALADYPMTFVVHQHSVEQWHVFYRKFVEDFEVPKVVISRCYGGSGVNFCFRLKVVCVGMSETEENIIVHVNL